MRGQWPKLVRDIRGMKARLRHEIRNGYMTIPAGALVVISGGSSRNRLDIRGERCEHCGIKPQCSRVDISSLIPEYDL